MKNALEDFDTKPFWRTVFAIIDTWECFANALTLDARYLSVNPRHWLAVCLVPPILIVQYISRDTLVEVLQLIFGVVFFGQPIFTRVQSYLDKEYNDWGRHMHLRNTVLKGVPTNAQLAVAVLRAGEQLNTPLLPPPELRGSPSLGAAGATEKSETSGMWNSCVLVYTLINMANTPFRWLQ